MGGGIPSNQGVPILQAFRPYQSHPGSSSEQNRRGSMMRKGTGKAKKRAKVANNHGESPDLGPVDEQIAVVLFPLNVCVFYLPSQWAWESFPHQKMPGICAN